MYIHTYTHIHTYITEQNGTEHNVYLERELSVSTSDSNRNYYCCCKHKSKYKHRHIVDHVIYVISQSIASLHRKLGVQVACLLTHQHVLLSGGIDSTVRLPEMRNDAR